MKILLIQPKMSPRPMDTSMKARMSPSLALLTIQNLTPSCHSVKIVNENIEEIDYSIAPDIVAITVTVDVLNKSIDIAKRFQNVGVRVVAGGIHITSAPKTAKGKFDSILIGRAEATWLPMLEDLANGCLKEEYSDTNENSYIKSPNYLIENKSKYIYTNIVATSRGCPYKCDFCYNSSSNSVPYINRPIEDVLTDIIAIKRKHILFIDDNFCGNLSWTQNFLDAIIPMKIKWSAAVCANIGKYPDLLDQMKTSGCQSLFIGFESIRASSLKQVNKNQNNVDEYEKLVEELHKRGIMINASLVFGLPDDDIHTFELTLKWLVRNKIETATAHIMTPYPGTKSYNCMSKEGKIVDHNLSHYDTAHVVFSHDNMTPKQIYDGYINFYKQFYSYRNILRRMPIDKQQRIAYLCFNLFYRKFGKLTEIMSNVIPLNWLGRFAAWISYFI